jgi:hypothetical protein
MVRYKIPQYIVMLICFLLLESGSHCYGTSSAVTYTFEGAGRFGDCVVIYCKAKYYAVTYGLPLLYKPFNFSDELVLHMSETSWTQDRENKFHHKKRVRCARDIDLSLPDTLYIVDLFTTFADVAPRLIHTSFEPVDHWINLFADEVYLMMQQDCHYKKIIKEMLKPIKALPVQYFPEGHISVAVHIRTGGGFDGNIWSKQLYSECKRTEQKTAPIDHWIADCSCPLRFPPLQFYIQHINALTAYVDGYPLYIEIFTDDTHPQDILNTIKKHCRVNGTITLGTTGTWQNRTIEDIYYMSMFDCLIRPCSFFSGVAQIIGNHKFVIRPEDFCFDSQTLYITDTMYTFYDGAAVSAIKVPYELTYDGSLKKFCAKILL